MQELDRLDYQMVRNAYPDRYNRGELASVSIMPQKAGRFVVKFPDSDDGHQSVLANAPAGYFGTCSCDGYDYHDGPCSHLSILRRAVSASLVEPGYIEPETISGELRDPDQELADTVDHGPSSLTRDYAGP